MSTLAKRKELNSPKRGIAVASNLWLLGFSRRWLLIITLVLGLYIGLPWLAPVLMRIGWTSAGNAIYGIYSTQCHQLPQRSYFLFGPKIMYSLPEIQTAWQTTNSPFILRQFVGNEALGWKVAWSDRMVSMYAGIFFSGLLYWPFRKRLKPLPLWAFALLILPMAIDGGSHMLSDLSRGGAVGLGFRDSNVWLVSLTNNILPASFYAGDALSSFNWWMRLVSGLLFGLGIVGLVYPWLEVWMADTAGQIEAKFKNKGIAV